MPSLGFAMGIERLLMLMDKQGIEIPKPSTCDLYVAVMGESASLKSFEIIKAVRSCGLIAETDVVGRGLRAQMKYADKSVQSSLWCSATMRLSRARQLLRICRVASRLKLYLTIHLQRNLWYFSLPMLTALSCKR